MNAEALIIDFERGVGDLAGLPSFGYNMLRESIPAIAHAVYPESFANEVDAILERFRQQQ